MWGRLAWTAALLLLLPHGQANYMLERLLNMLPDRSSRPASAACPPLFSEVRGRCYHYGAFQASWYRAAEYCHSLGEAVSLACVDDSVENWAIKRWLLYNGDHKTGAWIGGSDNGHHGIWAWFPTGQQVRYTDWGPSQPTGGDQHCMYIVGGMLGYQWADLHCEFEMNFICEYRANQVTPWWR